MGILAIKKLYKFKSIEFIEEHEHRLRSYIWALTSVVVKLDDLNACKCCWPVIFNWSWTPNWSLSIFYILAFKSPKRSTNKVPFFFFFQHCAFCSCSYHLSFIISRMPLANVPYSYCGLVAIIYWWLNPYHLREKIKRNPYACSFKSISGGPTYKFTHVKIILLFSVLSLCQILIQLELGPLPEALLFLNYVLLVINLRKETWFDLFVFLFFLNMFYTCDQFDNILNVS